eukprot:5473441-Amphidinium_carterae.1
MHSRSVLHSCCACRDILAMECAMGLTMQYLASAAASTAFVLLLLSSLTLACAANPPDFPY